MSGATDEAKTVEELFDPSNGDAAFAQLMDTMVSEADDAPGGEGDEEAPAAADGAGSPAPDAEGAGAEAADAAAPADGAEGEPAVPSGDADAPVEQPQPGTPEPVDGWTADVTSLRDEWSKVTQGFEQELTKELQQQAFNDVKTEYSKYFEALQKHPRTLVGEEVPSVKGEGMETLRDSEDAREWQEAVKESLGAEIRDRVSRATDDHASTIRSLTGATEIFSKNDDLVPYTKQFDKELADRFVKLAEPYKLVVNDRFVGYQIDVQPLINQVRTQLATERAAKPAPPAEPAAPTAQQQRAAEQPRNGQGQFHNEDAPQAGLSSKAGQSNNDSEDFSTLFGTLGLPGLRI